MGINAKRSGINFSNNKYGDVIFLAKPGIAVYPNCFHGIFPNYIKALHGYDPEDDDSYGIFFPIDLKEPTWELYSDMRLQHR